MYWWKLGRDPLVTTGGRVDPYFTIGFNDIISQRIDKIDREQQYIQRCYLIKRTLKNMILFAVICGAIYFVVVRPIVMSKHTRF